MKYAFIRDHQGQFSVAAMCRVLSVSRSGYYEWQHRPRSAREQADDVLLHHIHRIHCQHRQAYGMRKTWKALNAEGVICGRDRIGRLRREQGIEARRSRRFRITREHHKAVPVVPDLLERQFHASAPNKIWVGDITFIRTREGWLFLAALLDLYSRRVVGWSMDSRATEGLVTEALEMALHQRRPGAGLIHHTDRGSQYSAYDYQDKLRRSGVLPSMTQGKNPRDNAVAESFFSNLKNELVHHCDFRTRSEAKAAIFDYIELFYNRNRLHATLGYATPIQFERKETCSQ